MAPQKIKLQAVLSPKSYEHWAMERMLDSGWENADLTRTIVRDWLAFKHDDLKRDYGIDRAAWDVYRRGNVRDITKAGKAKAGAPAEKP